jgi:hypothetical protein
MLQHIPVNNNVRKSDDPGSSNDDRNTGKSGSDMMIGREDAQKTQPLNQ